MKKLLKARIKMDCLKMKVQERVKKSLSNEKGGYVLEGIVFMAIILLGLLAASDTMQDYFTNSISKFTNWSDGKLTTLFN
jgi:hypothetical protein